MKIYKRYWIYIKEYKFQFLLIFAGIVLTVSATIATAQIMQPLMDDMFIKKDETMLYLIPLMLVIIYVVKAVGRYIQSVTMTYVGRHIITRFRSMLLEKILYFDMQFLFTNRSGELISRLTNDLNRIQYFVSNMLPELVRESLTVLGLIGYVVYLNPELAFYSLVVVPVVFYPIIAIAKKLKKYSHRSQAKNADVVVRLTEVFNNSEIIKANATEAYEMERFSKENWKFFKINMKATYVGQLISPIMELVGAVGLAAVIYMGGTYVYNGTMTVGEFTAFLTAVGLVFQPVRRIGTIYSKIQDAVAASERVFQVLDRENSIIDGDTVLDEPVKDIRIEAVDLFYGEKQVLKNIDLAVHEGQNIALVGDSGGGKSSLVNLLVRFYDATRGSVRINGRDIKVYTQHSLREQIAIVSQRVYIMQDTLAQNVAYGHEVDEERVIDALKHADAYDFVMGMEEGIHTMMEEFGANLSGGQRQRIAIARAIYKNASLLILDEATSALDNETEKRIQNALEDYAKDKITITIAHRLSTIESADMILVFQAGEIVARGRHEELLESSSVYQRLSGTLS
ncbi:ABC transporter ATP-binding protein [Sulfurimonas sp. HSL3-7]|uniref:ABC transporter ATP-binding protein n=1 Tax=Sulfonitrofixus jiaomeiensis TaxID=3131938 RepID=UPI0031F77B3C